MAPKKQSSASAAAAVPPSERNSDEGIAASDEDGLSAAINSAIERAVSKLRDELLRLINGRITTLQHVANN